VLDGHIDKEISRISVFMNGNIKISLEIIRDLINSSIVYGVAFRQTYDFVKKLKQFR
jgi:hypothetical protein